MHTHILAYNYYNIFACLDVSTLLVVVDGSELEVSTLLVVVDSSALVVSVSAMVGTKNGVVDAVVVVDDKGGRGVLKRRNCFLVVLSTSSASVEDSVGLKNFGLR